MGEFGKIIGIIFAILVLLTYIGNLLLFTFTDDIKSGIWVAIFLLCMVAIDSDKEAD